MFFLRFSVSKFLINLRRQFRVVKFFRVRRIFLNMFWRDLQSFHFVYMITFSKMRNLRSRLLFHENLPINRLLIRAFVSVNGIVFLIGLK